jgi:hypothetical protein
MVMSCRITLSNLTKHAVARPHQPACWQISSASIKELRGRPVLKRTKAALDDQEILDLIDAIETRNGGRANGMRVLTLYGLQPVLLAAGRELKGQHGAGSAVAAPVTD